MKRIIFLGRHATKEIRNKVHTDLYDNLDIIPFDKMDEFLKINMK